MTKKIAILGSTGSIGKNALRVMDGLGPKYEVVALSAHSSVELLTEQARRYRPKYVALTGSDDAEPLGKLIGSLDFEILTGPEGLVRIARLKEVDTLLVAVVGVAGLPAVLAAAQSGGTLAVANKESLVVAGELLMKTARDCGGTILPVDSEHSAVFQAMQAGRREEVRRIILTASGGPFRKASLEDIRNATLKDALAHPTWNMGPKITVDSATMVNKAFEFIAARWLFDIPPEKIKILVHPESIVHSLVEFVDGSVVAELGLPDMCLPIQYSLTYPERVAGVVGPLRLEQIGKLTFEEPDLEKFRALSLGFEVARTGGTTAAVFNAANEVAVEEFLAGRINFVRIVELVEDCLNKHDVKTGASLDELFEADAWARKQVKQSLKRNAKSVRL